MTHETERVILISLSDNTEEIEQLIDTLGYATEKKIVQHRENPDVNYFIGVGKLDEVKKVLDETESKIDVVIVNGILKPSQWFNLERSLNISVYDRIHIILAIFEDHAKRKEAQLQVKLAQLQYERPYVRELIHRTRAGEHPGFMAGGEYQVDDYYEMIKKQIKKIGGDLRKIETSRSLQRKHRHSKGFYLISLAGYTNAGKSSLMNVLTDAEVLVEGKLFSTLSTTTRRLIDKEYGPKVPVLITDTVGFIDDLPSWVVDAFHATLEEIEMADVVVLVIDASEATNEIDRKVKVSFSELRELNVTAPVIVAFNKADMLKNDDHLALEAYVSTSELLSSRKCLILSAKNLEHIDELLTIIYSSLPNLVELVLCLPISSKAQSFLSYLYSNTNVQDVSYGEEMIVRVSCNSTLIPNIQKLCTQVQGKVIFQKQKNI